MKDRLRITITDVNGSRHFNVHQIIKKVIFFSVVFIVSLFIIGTVSIRVLMDQVDVIENKKKLIQDEYENMVDKNQNLLNEIQIKSDELLKISDKISEIEDIVGVVNPQEDDDRTLYERVDIASITSAQKALVLQLIPNGSPIKYTRISSTYGSRIHPILKKREYHPGIDLRAPRKTPIYAPADGVVEYTRGGYAGGYGNMIKLGHSFGFGSIYAHLYKVEVNKGDFIKKGQLIGYVGSTGLSTGPHLHYEIRFLGKTLDPYSFMEWTMKDYTAIFEKERHIKWDEFLTTIKNLTSTQGPLQSQQVRK
jgi:murein DD-endopeptidase MepM/ murein hydrolase activator NlpD